MNRGWLKKCAFGMGILGVLVLAGYYYTYDIWRAVRNGNVSYVERYLKNGGAVDTVGEFGYDVNSREGDYSLLMEAARYGQPEIVKLLISRGADVNKQSTLGRFPLLYAAQKGNVEIITLLLDKGVDPSSHMARPRGRSGSVNTPLEAAVFFKHEPAQELLLKRGARITEQALWLAAYLPKNEKLLTNMLSRDVANIKDEQSGKTIVHNAASANRIDILKKFLALGSEINALDDDTQTPLFFRIYFTHWLEEKDLETIKFLLEQGANPNIASTRKIWMGEGPGPAYGVVATNFTPLMAATEKCDTEKSGRWLKVIELLLAHGADINARSSDGKTAADYARGSDCDNSKIAEFLEQKMKEKQ